MSENLSAEHLETLRYWLKYELSAALLFLVPWFTAIFIVIITIAAVIFTPFLLKVLFKENKTGWIIAFFIMAILPAVTVVLFLLFKINPELVPFLVFVPLGGFYLFCFLLKISIDDWISEKRAYIERINYKKPEVKFEDLWPRR